MCYRRIIIVNRSIGTLIKICNLFQEYTVLLAIFGEDVEDDDEEDVVQISFTELHGTASATYTIQKSTCVFLMQGQGD